MAGLAVLEREIEKISEQRKQENREISNAEKEHSSRISANFNALRFSNSTAWADTLTRENERPVQMPEKSTPVQTSAAQRISDYTAVAAPATKTRRLFEDLEYKNGELIGLSPAPAPVSAPASDVAAMPAAVPAAPAQEEDDDALPTRRTMDTLSRSVAQTAQRTEAKTSFLSALSTRAKIVLAAITFAVVLAIVVICVNTSIINSLNADLGNLRARAAEQQETYGEIQTQIEDYQREDNEKVAEWAIDHGMTKE